MTDPVRPAPSVQIPTRPVTSQEYIERLRLRRQAQSQPVAQEPVPQPTPAAPQPVEPVTAAPPPEPQVQPTPDILPVDESMTDDDVSTFFPGVVKPLQEETVFTWVAASRPFKKRDRQYYTTIGAIVFLVSLILFFAGQLLPIAVVVSVGFLAYVLSSVPPELVTYKLTTFGIRIEDAMYQWDEMGRYWMEQKLGQSIIHVEVARFPNRLTLVLGDQNPEELRSILSEVLVEEKPKPTFYDKVATWLQEKIPLEVTGR